MLKQLLKINTSWWEFLIKFPIVLFIIMPLSMGGAFWLGLIIDSLIHIHLFKLILPFGGTVLGVYLTALLILAGHTNQLKEV
jgi:hypothetical protein